MYIKIRVQWTYVIMVYTIIFVTLLTRHTHQTMTHLRIHIEDSQLLLVQCPTYYKST